MFKCSCFILGGKGWSYVFSVHCLKPHALSSLLVRVNLSKELFYQAVAFGTQPGVWMSGNFPLFSRNSDEQGNEFNNAQHLVKSTRLHVCCPYYPTWSLVVLDGAQALCVCVFFFFPSWSSRVSHHCEAPSQSKRISAGSLLPFDRQVHHLFCLPPHRY